MNYFEASVESAKLAVCSAANKPRPPLDAFCTCVEAPRGEHAFWAGYAKYDDFIFLRSFAICWENENVPSLVSSRMIQLGRFNHQQKLVVVGDLDCALADLDRQVAVKSIRRSRNSAAEIQLYSGSTAYVLCVGAKGIRYEGSQESWGMLFDMDLEQELEDIDGWVELRISDERFRLLATKKHCCLGTR